MKKLSLEAKPWLCFFCFLVLSAAMLNAQENVFLKGQVVDENEEPLPFVLVSDFENSDYSDTTDFNGKFEIETFHEIDSVRFSFIGLPSVIAKADYDGMKVKMTFPLADSIQIVQGGRGVVSPFQIVPPPPVRLPETRIISRRFMQNPLGSSVFPISQIGAKEIESTNGFSMHDALNLIPGVQMDSRGHNGSRRLNLRGTVARSPFGVRNIRLKLNGFSLTSSDGSSALELLEPSEISLINLYKGPSGSYEMTGTGGVFASNLLPVYSRKLRGEITYGEFEFFRAKAGVNFGKNKLRSRVSLVHSFNQSYRSQEANNKTQITLETRYRPESNRLSYDALFILYDGYWELPGHLTLEDAEENPRQADPDSEDLNAHVKRRRAYFGVHQSYTRSRFSNDTRIFGQISDKYNPYGTHPVFFQGIKDENSFDLGLRSEFAYVAQGNDWNPKLRLKAGTQWQVFGTNIDEYNNISGEKGTLKYANETDILEGLIFLSADYNPFDKLKAAAQIGYNVYNLKNSGSNFEETALDFNSGTQVAILPRLGVNYQYSAQGQASISYSQGIGYPSIFEWVDVDSGIFSPDLKPELSSNFEFVAGQKFYESKSEIDIKLTAYKGTVQNTIVENANSNEAIFYTNQGESIQQGIEFQGGYTRLRDANNQWGIFSTLALQDYRFKNDTTDDKLRVPGIPELKGVLGVNYGLKNWTGNVTGTYISPIATSVGPEFEENTDYFLVNAKIGRKFNSRFQWNYVLEVGVNNILNEFYTSFYRLNASGRVYNPMPERNGFVSFKVNFE